MAERKVRVLVVDDEAAIRESLHHYLADCEFDVTSASSGEEALEILESESRDVAIIDLRLPGMTGDALIAHLHEMNPKMHFVIHTGSVNYQLPESLRSIGMTDEHIFLKPLADLSPLVEMVKKLEEQRSE